MPNDIVLLVMLVCVLLFAAIVLNGVSAWMKKRID